MHLKYRLFFYKTGANHERYNEKNLTEKRVDCQNQFSKTNNCMANDEKDDELGNRQNNEDCQVERNDKFQHNDETKSESFSYFSDDKVNETENYAKENNDKSFDEDYDTKNTGYNDKNLNEGMVYDWSQLSERNCWGETVTLDKHKSKDFDKKEMVGDESSVEKAQRSDGEKCKTFRSISKDRINDIEENTKEENTMSSDKNFYSNNASQDNGN